jgi:hypothetical protein
MFKYIHITFFLASLITINSPLLGVEKTTYTFPESHTANSPYIVKYEDLNEVLGGVVLNIGRSLHVHAQNRVSQTGTKFRRGNQKSTWLESNRILYSHFTEGTRSYIKEIILRLQRVSEEVSLDQFSKNEQLAYWLNLHNIIVIHEISKRYPITNIQKLYLSGSNCAPTFKNHCAGELDQTAIFISGQRTSLGQLRRHIVENWSDPLVIYGLYMGYIGGPNIRESAYKGKTVWEQLRSNAEEFTNSIRGTQLWGNTLRISEHYNFVAPQLLASEGEIYAHLHKYADRKLKGWLAKAERIKITVQDGSINDLYNGQPYILLDVPEAVGDIIAPNPTINLRNYRQNYGAFTDLAGHPLLRAFQKGIQKKFKRQRLNVNPNVEIEEVSHGDADDKNKDNNKNQKKQ